MINSSEAVLRLSVLIGPESEGKLKEVPVIIRQEKGSDFMTVKTTEGQLEIIPETRGIVKIRVRTYFGAGK